MPDTLIVRFDDFDLYVAWGVRKFSPNLPQALDAVQRLPELMQRELPRSAKALRFEFSVAMTRDEARVAADRLNHLEDIITDGCNWGFVDGTCHFMVMVYLGVSDDLPALEAKLLKAIAG